MPASQVNVLSVIAGLAKAAGGPTTSVIALTEATVRFGGSNNTLASVIAPAGEPEATPSPELVPLMRVRGFHFPALRFVWSPTFKSELRQRCRQMGINVIHSHGIWTQPNHAAVALARELGLPLMISTHGMLVPWAWRHHAWKKRPAWWLWQYRDLRSAAVLRATAPQEVKALRALGLHNPIALIANGVALPDANNRQEASPQNLRTLVFLGRIHPVKGLMNLVKAWALLRPSGWRCIIAGPDETGHRQEVEQELKKNGITACFTFAGMVDGQEKWRLLAEADLFALPSFTENFGVAIAEAMACGVPVITTKGTPWEELHTRRCGWWIDIGVDPLTGALREAMALSDEQRLAMGQRGRRLVEENYSWPKIGRDITAVYAWMLGSGTKPECVV